MTIPPIHHVNLTVTDLDRSVEFYTKVLGWRKTMEAPVDRPEYQIYLRLNPGTTGRMAILQADDRTIGELELIQWDPPLADATPPKRVGDPGVNMICFEVVDETLRDLHERLTAEGFEFWSDITPVALDGYPPFHVVLIQDPDGVLLELIQLPTADDVRAFRAALKAGAAS